jgi:PhnB protein
MKTELYPFIRFNDNKGMEAMNFYKSVFGGELDTMLVKDSPMAKDMPADKQSNIMHSVLKNGKITFIGMDMMRDKATVGDNVGISLNCESEEELRDLFAKLSEGGEIFMAPEMQFWGGVFGVLTDKYGVEWMLNYQNGEMKK